MSVAAFALIALGQVSFAQQKTSIRTGTMTSHLRPRLLSGAATLSRPQPKHLSPMGSRFQKSVLVPRASEFASVAFSEATRTAIQVSRAVLQASITLSILALLGRFVVDTTEGVNRNDDVPQKLIKTTEPILGPVRKVVPKYFEVDISAIAICSVLLLFNELVVAEKGILNMLAAKR
uniref:Uncharacterized protein n=2 Tax=Lotharella oceanica TaxID=641309 RepID=A0A7S2TK61_9EUKA|mmetsp:Transcript_1750/g.3300  ORF Transcript_1750/g.3300 Transcript_1750/m.3300 type:complete len:177 (+) Transcript_1750:861-1391(+)